MTRIIGAWFRSRNLWFASVVLVVGCSWVTQASAQELRRPGLGGAFATRRLTAPMNSLAMVGGPGQPTLFAQRYQSQEADGGLVSYHRDVVNGRSDDELWFRGGVIFGLTENLEAGALFLSFRWTPDLAYADFPVYITYGWHFGNVDVGARLSFLTPAETEVWAFNPGVPVVVRLGKLRIDTGAFLPVRAEDPIPVGLQVPVRLAYNVTPNFFGTFDTGVYENDFGTKGDTSISLGGLLGYTSVVGARVVDTTIRFMWNDFVRFAPPPGYDAVDAKSFRLMAGLTIHSLVM